MKVNSPDISPGKAATSDQKNTLSKAEIQAKIEAKFGAKVGEKKDPKPDVLVSINKKGEKKVEEDFIGDIRSNDPSSKATQEKLKGLLSSGGFHFNSKERAALSEILMK